MHQVLHTFGKFQLDFVFARCYFSTQMLLGTSNYSSYKHTREMLLKVPVPGRIRLYIKTEADIDMRCVCGHIYIYI